MALHKAPPLKTIKVLSRLKFNKKGHRTKEEIKNTTFQEHNISSISKFIKSNFSDKMTYMLQREFKARTIAEREKDPIIIESNLLKDAQKILHTSIFGQEQQQQQQQQQQQHHLNTKDDSKEQQQHQLFQQKKWGEHSASNLHLYEEEEDNKINNEKQRIGHPLYQCKQKYNQHKYKEAHVHAKEFISICQENEKEMAFRQNVITLRALACDGDGDDTGAMKLKEAQNLFNYDVIAPKIYQKEERGFRIRHRNNNSLCARCGCNSNSVSYCDLNAPYLSNKNMHKKEEDEEIEKRRGERRRGRRRRKRSQMKRNELIKEREEQVSTVRRAVVQSCQTLKNK